MQRSKKTTKTNIKVKKKELTQLAKPRFTSKPQNSKNRRIDTGPCPPDTGRVRMWMLFRRKDNNKGQNWQPTQGRAKATQGVVNSKIFRICDSASSTLATGRAIDTWGRVSTRSDKQLMRKSERDGYGAVPGGHGPWWSFWFQL
ncbi:hypothetical protein HanHA300_Chr16g0602211 [Helianthus annuus]|nr:hypothetical protein HanHA300_Chr16g0602211 [Helianthus annuus]KAJ0459760.1 hypothetical protein HanHA89_Chr16g0652741 [Helianthus annuus]